MLRIVARRIESWDGGRPGDSIGAIRPGDFGVRGKRRSKRNGVVVADAPLRIAVDGRELVGRTTGVGRYLLEILRCWREDARHEFSIVVPSPPSDELRALSNRFTWIVEPADVGGT